MSIDSLNPSIYALAKKRLLWLAQKQSLAATNIAHGRVPKYLPKDVKPFRETLKGKVKPLSMQQTQTGHHNNAFVVQAEFVASLEQVVRVDPNDISPSGNGVVLEKELMKSSEAGIKFREAMLLVERFAKMRKAALPGRR